VNDLRWAAIVVLALAPAVTACTAYDDYLAGESQKYSGEALFTMYPEWGTPVSRTRLLTGGKFYRFRKPATGCTAAAWTDDLDIVLRVALAGPSVCAAGS
jgi:hypothetical protein